MTNIVKSTTPVTMTSIELVEYINSQRGEGESVLAHSDFLKKVPQVLGEKDAGKFSSIYRDSMNRKKPCYRFPKREACLMAMSYSYELQAKVFDRMTELEAAVKQTPQVVKVSKTTSDLAPLRQQRAIGMAIDNGERLIGRFPDLGIKSQQSIIASLVNAAAGTVIVPLALLSEKLLSATDVGAILGVSRNMIGRIAKQHNLKTAEYGEWILGEAEFNGTQRSTFVYNSKAVAVMRSLISANDDGRSVA